MTATPQEKPARESNEEIPLRRASRTLLRAEQLSKIFSIKPSWWRKRRLLPALNHVTLRLRRGETLGVTGAADSGKTTLGLTLLRLYTPSYGRIRFAGSDITHWREGDVRGLRKHMQMVFQDPSTAINLEMSIQTAAAEGLRNFRMSGGREAEQKKVRDCLTELGFDPPSITTPVGNLSAGQRQLIGAARSLLLKPDLLWLDEPLTMLDTLTRRKLLSAVYHHQTDNNAAIALVSQELDVIETTTDRTAVMYFGHLVEIGPTERVFSKPLHPYTRVLLNARPTADPEHRRLRVVPEQAGPSIFSPPEGCPFFAQCPRKEPGHCDKEMPHLRSLSGRRREHRVACFHPHA